MSEISVLDVRVPAEIIHNWGWFLAFGIGLVLLGVLAIVRSVAATVVSMPALATGAAAAASRWAGLPSSRLRASPRQSAILKCFRNTVAEGSLTR